MSFIISLLVAGVLTDNIVLSGLLGLGEATESNSPFIETLKKCGITAALVFLSSVITYPVIRWLLAPIKIAFLGPLVCVLVVCGLCFAAFVLTKKLLPSVYAVLDRYKEVMTCSALVLGICLRPFGAASSLSYPAALLYSVAAMLGFLLVSVIFRSLRPVIFSEALPTAVRGLPMTLIVASLFSMAFYAFTGM